MISSERSNATLEKVLLTKLKRPEKAGHLWKGVPHGDLIQGLFEAGARRGWERHYFQAELSRDGADLACSWCIDGPFCPFKDISLAIGLVTSNARRRALRFFVGAIASGREGSVVVSDFLGGRYTMDFDLETECSNAMDRWVKETRKLPASLNILRGNALTLPTVEAILFAAGRGKILPWSRIGRVDREWRSDKERNGWSLLQAFSWQCQLSPAHDQMQNTLRFSQLILRALRGKKTDSISLTA